MVSFSAAASVSFNNSRGTFQKDSDCGVLHGTSVPVEKLFSLFALDHVVEAMVYTGARNNAEILVVENEVRRYHANLGHGRARK